MRQPLNRTKRILRTAFLFVIGLLVVGAGFWRWKTKPPPVPVSTQRTLFEGITYVRDVRRQPRPLVIHVVTVDLSAPGLSFLVTPGDPKLRLPLRARTTSGFLEEFKVQIAINGDFFTPWHSSTPWDYYPHIGDPVRVDGFAASRGVIYSTVQYSPATLYLGRDNRASIDQPIGKIYNAISGNTLLVSKGEIMPPRRKREDLHPRTAIGLDRKSRRLILVVVDGRQSTYSQGVTMTELAEIMIRYGSHTAINLDGGGSAALVVADETGQPIQLNSPIDNRFPGRERPVANHLGIFARRTVKSSQ